MITSFSNFLHTYFEKLFGPQFSKEGFITYARNIQWTAIARIVTMGFSLITTIIVARILGPERFGTLNYVLSLNVLFAVLANLGIDNLIYKELINHKDEREAIIGSAITLKYITGVIAILSLSISLFFINETPYIKLLAFVLSLSFLTQPLLLLTYDFLSNKEAHYVSIVQILTSFVSNSLKIAAVFLYGSLLYLIVILVIENSIAGLLYLFYIRKAKRSIRFVVTKKEIWYLCKLAIPLTFFSAFSEIYSRIDQIMLKAYLDEKAVGLYAAAVRLTEIWNVLPNIFFGSLFPAFVNTVTLDSKEYKRRVSIFIIILGGILATICVGTFLISPLLIHFVYGPDFYAASPLLSVYIFSLFGSIISMFIIQDLFLKNRYWFTLILPFSTAVLNIVLNLYLIPTHGALGAALATVISYNIIPLGYLVLKKSF